MEKSSYPRGKLIVGIVIIAVLLAFGWYLASLDGRIAIVTSGEATPNTTALSTMPLPTIGLSTQTSTPILPLLPTSTSIPYTLTPFKGVQNPDNGHWYLVFSQTTWDNAINYCASKGGHLVTIDDAEENLFVYDLAPYVLLGATDKEREGQW